MAGYLVFLAGTLDSLNRIFNIQRNLMRTSSELRNKQSELSFYKKIQSNVESSIQLGMNNKLLAANSVFNDTVAKLDPKSADYNTAFTKARIDYESQQTQIAMEQQVVKRASESVNSVMIDYLTMEEQNIKQEQEDLQAELTEVKEEYKNEKDALKEAAKEAAPTFGN